MKSKWIILILTAVLVFSAALSSSLAESGAENAIPLVMTSGEKAVSAEASVEIGETAYFSFCPSETGYYSIYPTASTDSDSWNEPSLTLYDSGLNELTYESATLYGDITFELDAGALYYIGATVSDGESPDNLHRFTVNVERIRGLICASAGEVTSVHPGQPFTMTVDTQAETGTVLIYQWQEYNPDTFEYESITDATAASCTIQSGKRSSYLCAVSDQYGRTKKAYFEIYVDNNLTVDDSASILVPYGETTVLEVHASCLAGELRYQWFFGSDGEFMEGETEPFLETVPITTQTKYECSVYDDYENAISVIFDVNVDNHLRVTQALINGETLKTYNLPLHFYANTSFLPETPIIAEVHATCDQGELHYSWSDETSNSLGIHQPILTYGPLKASVSLRCMIEDDFGNTEVVTIHISMNNYVTATYISGIHDRISPSYYNDSIESTILVDESAPCTLTVKGSCAVGNLHYRWYTVDDNTYSYELIEGQTTNTLTIESVNYACHYRCVITDDYIGPYSYSECYGDLDVDFHVLVDNLIIEEPDTHTEFFYHELISATPGQSLDLSVKAYVKKGHITYMWYRDDIGSRILSHTSSVNIANVTGNHFYICRITDDFGNTASIRFKVNADNGLYIEPVIETLFSSPGESINLSVHTSVIMGPLTFKWYDSDGNLLSSTADTATIQAPTENGEYNYTCQVEDAYENKRTTEFTVIVGKSHVLTQGQSITVTPDLPYTYFSFTTDKTAFYSFTVSGQEDNSNLELFDLYGDTFYKARDIIIKRLYLNRTYYYRVETKGSPLTVSLDIVPDISCGSYTLQKNQRIDIPYIGENENMVLAGFEILNPNLLSDFLSTITAKETGETDLYAISYKQQGIYHITVVDPTEGVFILPAHLTSLQDGAFAGIAGIRYAELNEALPVLPAGAFADADLVQLVVHGKQTVIEDGAFSGKPLILCPEGSKAAEYARGKGLPWLYLAKEN